MRGLSLPTGGITPSPLASTPEAEKRLPYDLRGGEAAARRGGLSERLRRHARLPEQPLHQRREDLRRGRRRCWRRSAYSVKVNAKPRATYFPKCTSATPACTCSAGAAPSPTPRRSSRRCCTARTAKGDGDYNWGNYANAKLDALIDAATHEADAAKRKKLIAERARRAQRADPPRAAAPAGHSVGDAPERAASCTAPTTGWRRHGCSID